MKCLKCGFDIREAKASSCPKCGVIFAKVQRALEEEAAFKRRIAAERSISAAMEREMESDEDIRASLSMEPDLEYARDEAAYPVTRFLSGLFVFLAAFTALIEIAGLIHFYHWGKVFFSQRDLVLIMISLAVFSAASVVVLLAIAEGLKMGRDVANHVRASREYLRRIAGR